MTAASTPEPDTATATPAAQDSAATTAFDDLELFREYRDGRRRRVRNELVERHMGLAAHIAKRYSRDRQDDDLRQVAMMALVKAVDRFDPDRGVPFSAFAGRTIEGELKRHFRDATWAVQVPRSAKELHLGVRRASEELGHRLGRPPTVDEVATHLGVDRDDVVTGLAAGTMQSTAALEPGADEDRPEDHQRALASHEAGFDLGEHRAVVAPLLERLPERERRIVELRFFEELSQSDIADRMGISQMHVSRLLRRSLEDMRAWMSGAAESS